MKIKPIWAKTKIKSLIALVMFSAASLTLLFALPNTQPNKNAQTQPQVTVPGMVSTSGGNGGMHTRADTVLPSARYGAHIDLNQTSVTLDQLDIRSVTLTAPNQIGVNRSVAVSPKTRAQKFVNPDGSQIIVLIIKTSGASGIGVHFRNFALARGEQVYVYGPAGDSIVFGPFTNKGPWGSGEFWSGTVTGDTAVIEFYTRTDKTKKAFEVFEVSHIFPELDLRLRSDEPEVMSCEVDAQCYPNILNNSVARIVFNNNGPSVCTGTLLQDVAQDHTPYFLTANHCVNSQAVAQTVEVYWFYQTTACNSGVLRSDIVRQTGGANLLATQSTNDFSLLRLANSAPGGAYFSGWTNGAQSTGTGVFGLHHPGLCYPGLCIDSYLRRASGTITSTNADCPITGLVNGYQINWTSGTTEEGSSGSGIWNSVGYLVGVLSCGNGTCSGQYSLYSKFASFYPQIEQYIGSGTPTPTPTPHSNVTDLGTLGGSNSYGYGVNNSGQVTGTSDIAAGNQYHAFLYSNGSMQDLPTLGGLYSSGHGINNSGQVTGASYIAGNQDFHAFLYSDGSMRDLGTLGGRNSEGLAINNGGQITGSSDYIAGYPSHAFLYSNGTMMDLILGQGNAINDLGQVAGTLVFAETQHAFLYSNGSMQDLGTLGGQNSQGYGINNAGQVVGSAGLPDGTQDAFLYSNGIMQDLHIRGNAYGINNLGQIVGMYGPGASRPFLLTNGTMYDLQSLVSGVTILQVRSINDLGQIAGDGSFNGGPTHAILLTPITHPAFFTGEIALGGGWYYLQFPNGTPFGYYSYLPDQNFIYHIDLGFEYLFDANDANHGIYFYDFASSSFFYTSPSTFPYLYDFSLNAWLYYLPDANNPGRYTHNPRWFYNFATGQWITL